MTIKAKLFGALFAAMTIAAPLALTATPAEAAPQHDMHRPDAMHDRDHKPAPRVEHRTHKPHGHYRWQGGEWNWNHGHWNWMPGHWMTF